MTDFYSHVQGRLDELASECTSSALVLTPQTQHRYHCSPGEQGCFFILPRPEKGRVHGNSNLPLPLGSGNHNSLHRK